MTIMNMEIPEEIIIEYTKQLREVKDEEGNRKYSDDEIARVLIRVEDLIKSKKIKITKK